MFSLNKNYLNSIIHSDPVLWTYGSYSPLDEQLQTVVPNTTQRNNSIVAHLETRSGDSLPTHSPWHSLPRPDAAWVLSTMGRRGTKTRRTEHVNGRRERQREGRTAIRNRRSRMHNRGRRRRRRMRIKGVQDRRRMVRDRGSWRQKKPQKEKDIIKLVLSSSQ